MNQSYSKNHIYYSQKVLKEEKEENKRNSEEKFKVGLLHKSVVWNVMLYFFPLMVSYCLPQILEIFNGFPSS